MSADTENKGFNWNWVALGILIIGYLFSAGRFFVLSAQNDGTDQKKIVRVAHWQLEPGYRDALQWAMDKYNNLPHVKEAGVQVEQIPLPTRVYNQFMNVHLISGTAPDIASAGFTSMIQGNAIARFYASLGEYASQPNPYNSREFTSPDLDPELRDYLANAPWKDTFLDGMEGGWKQELNDYFSAPISNIGGLRMFYNLKLVKQGKDFLRDAINKNPQPQWVQDCWLREENGETKGYLPDNQRLRDWLANEDEPPQTLGQFILFCYAIEHMAQEQGRETLVPISVGNYDSGEPILRYQPSFFRLLGSNMEQDYAPGISGLEATDALHRGDWTFEDEPMKAFVSLAQTLVHFYPAGYQGLDREQVQRRFVSGEAAVFSSGSWDAAGVFKGAQESDNPDRRFEVEIDPVPMPAPDERWGDMLNYLPSEADFRAGVPLSINKQSKHFEWALDFIRFLSSQPINEEFNEIAAWLPATVGSKTTESMVDFEPIIEGYPSYESFNPSFMRSNIRNTWMADFRLMVAGEISFETFASNIMEYIDRPRQGVPAYWYHERLSAIDRTRALDRNISVEEFMQAAQDDSKAANRFRSLFYQSLTDDEGLNVNLMWHRLHPGEPFPEF